MKITLLFSRTVVSQVNVWDEFRRVEVEVPDYLAPVGKDYEQWHLQGALMPEQEARNEAD